MNIAYLSLGSNIGNRFDFLRKSVQLLNDSESIQVTQVSSVYETDPVGYVDQAAFPIFLSSMTTKSSRFSKDFGFNQTSILSFRMVPQTIQTFIDLVFSHHSTP